MYYSKIVVVNSMKIERLSTKLTVSAALAISLFTAAVQADRADLTGDANLGSAVQRVQDSTVKRFGCLPKDVRADEEVGYAFKGKPSITVQNKLTEMKARCRRGKLIDSKGRQIRFFRPSCRGNPPEDYQEIRQREDIELARLKKRYTVIEFECNRMRQ
jgi:hypothetical protein